ncbi:hypothetical protein VXP97_04605, partial [Acinetobacter sp. 207]
IFSVLKILSLVAYAYLAELYEQQVDVAHWLIYSINAALLHKDLKCKAPLIDPNLRRNLGKWAT